MHSTARPAVATAAIRTPESNSRLPGVLSYASVFFFSFFLSFFTSLSLLSSFFLHPALHDPADGSTFCLAFSFLPFHDDVLPLRFALPFSFSTPFSHHRFPSNGTFPTFMLLILRIFHSCSSSLLKPCLHRFHTPFPSGSLSYSPMVVLSLLSFSSCLLQAVDFT